MKNLTRRTIIKSGLIGTTGLFIAGKSLAMNKISLPGTEDFNILKYGAVGDGKTMNTEAIQKAIDACAENGGGRVVIPGGTFLSGGFVLKSNVNLHLEDDAVILGSPYMKDYQQNPLLSERRYQKYLVYCLVFAQGEHNITVSGTGTLNGNATLGGELGEFEDRGGTVHQRPCLLWFDECENILVMDITYKNAAGWTETYSCCRNIHVDNITVTENYFFNGDGCNMVDSENFIIENCNIDAIDDAICLKGYTQKGCCNGIIRNNRVRSIVSCGIKMGTDSSGGFRDILIENNEVWQTGISGIALEITDGGVMENVTVRNINMNVVGTPIFIMLSNRNRPIYGQLTVPNGVIRNVYIGGIKATVNKSKRFNDSERKHFMDKERVCASSITGFPENFVEDITIENVDIIIQGGFPIRTAEDTLRTIPEAGRNYPESDMFGVLPAYGFFIRHVRNIIMKNISVSIEQEDGRPAFLLDDVHDSKFDDIMVQRIKPTPAYSIYPNCGDVQIDLI